MKKLTIIGDVHGYINQRHPKKGVSYLDIIKGASHSVQIGDMGFDYHFLPIDKQNHKFFGGNHDNYDRINEEPSCLGDFGLTYLGGVEFFFVRGAFSIDKKYRQNTIPKTWWEKEQLSYIEGMRAIDYYQSVKPNIVLSHTCPVEIAELIGNPNVLIKYGFDPYNFRQETTQQILSAMFRIHKPKLWVFGHFHKNWSHEMHGTHFVCVDELNAVEINASGGLTI